MNNTQKMLCSVAATAALTGPAQSHIVAIGWQSLPGNAVEFTAQHWHGNSAPDGFLLFDGVQYPFTGYIWDTTSISGFDGGLVNSVYSMWDPATGTLTAIDTGSGLENNWLTVTVPNVSGGTHTLGSSDIPLTQWTLDGSIDTFSFSITPTTDSILLMATSLRTSSITSARNTVRGVGGRLTRLRSGVRSGTKTTTSAPPVTDAKGGMEKSPIVLTETCPWEIYGSVFYSSEDYDQQIAPGAGIPGTPFFGPTLRRPETEINTFGGWVGFDYDLSEHWTAGFAVSGSRSDVDMTFVGNSDIDTLALIPYVSYYRDAGSYAAWADLLYAYGMTDYDTFRLPSVVGDTEGDFHNIEFNIGVNLTHGAAVHGPFAQFRWLDGDIDGYQENGLGGILMPDQSYESIATQLGYQIAYHIDTSGGTKVVPNASVAWEHEFEPDQGTLFGLPLGEVDEDLLVVGAGVACFNGCGWTLSLDYEGRFGSEVQGHYVGTKFGIEF